MLVIDLDEMQHANTCNYSNVSKLSFLKLELNAQMCIDADTTNQSTGGRAHWRGGLERLAE